MKTLFLVLTSVLLTGCASQASWQTVLAPSPWVAPGKLADSYKRSAASTPLAGAMVERAWSTADGMVHERSAYTRQVEEYLRREPNSAALQSCLHTQTIAGPGGGPYGGTVQIISLDPLICLIYPAVRAEFWPVRPYVDFITAPDGQARLAIDSGPNAPADQPAAWFSPDLNVTPALFPANAASLTLPFKDHALVLTRVGSQWQTDRR